MMHLDGSGVPTDDRGVSYDDLFDALVEISDPTDKMGVCQFCDAEIWQKEPHYPECIWIKVHELTGG
jgi:hypothetical protein